MKKLFTTVLVMTLFLNVQNLLGQAQNREIGLRFTTFQNFGFIYKKELKENTFRRYRLGSFNFSGQANREFLSINTALNFATGKEKRAPINDKLWFIEAGNLIYLLILPTKTRSQG